ncbi:hypothetical protein AXF42_Ash014114 [Apostasia shenzhenica]|uniref:Fungal lipase-like domain-containing protein n=1 Tax=Apostasia shenzhenica TaxID=1088818 RepID=A0A2I0A9G2_9ASPA|nr:hypothetical protein AXF42_Ash014114 [Apostasia shenzhenica]
MQNLFEELHLPFAIAAAAACCGCLECVVCAACARWAWRRCSHAGAHDSASWPPAPITDFTHVPRACRAILAAYEDDLSRPRWAPSPGGYRMDPAAVVRRTSYADTAGRCPPYILYLDRANAELFIAVRGLNPGRGADYRLLLDNRPDPQPFDGGYVHRGILKAAVWLLNREADTLRRIIAEMGSNSCRVVIAGHSLGAGVAALVAAVMVNYLDRFGGIERERVRCYAVAPARCMSLNLAVKYADVINSVVLQDDFLLRTSTPLEDIFGSIFCLPCLMVLVCLRDTFVPEDKMLKDPKRLYAPGRLYHIIDRKSCSCGRMDPQVRTAVPVEGRFERIVLSCNAASDHSLIWVERQAQKALEMMMVMEGQQRQVIMSPPKQQTIEGEQSLEKELKVALEKTALLSKHDNSIAICNENSSTETYIPIKLENDETSSSADSKSDWDDLVEKLLISEVETSDLESQLDHSER